jgi:hypothetical protein
MQSILNIQECPVLPQGGHSDKKASSLPTSDLSAPELSLFKQLHSSKMKSLCLGTNFVLLAFLLSGHANAHHAVAVHFDKSQSVKVRGMVVEFELRSPHATIVIDGSIVGEDGNPVGDTERWEIASISAPGLRRLGMDRNTLKPPQMK